jgi:hypothetical protein
MVRVPVQISNRKSEYQCRKSEYQRRKLNRVPVHAGKSSTVESKCKRSDAKGECIVRVVNHDALRILSGLLIG